MSCYYTWDDIKSFAVQCELFLNKPLMFYRKFHNYACCCLTVSCTKESINQAKIYESVEMIHIFVTVLCECYHRDGQKNWKAEKRFCLLYLIHFLPCLFSLVSSPVDVIIPCLLKLCKSFIYFLWSQGVHCNIYENVNEMRSIDMHSKTHACQFLNNNKK